MDVRHGMLLVVVNSKGEKIMEKTKKENFKKINFNQARFLQKTCMDLMKKNPYYKKSDFEQAWEKFNQEQNLIKNNVFVPMLKSGNLKLSGVVGIFDLPSIITCKYACKNCYALKSERIYANTRKYRLKLLLHILYIIYNPQYKKAFLNNMIKNCMLFPIIRIHSSGDMFHENYFKFWLQVAENCKKTKFYTYTKILTDSRINYFNEKYKNFNIVKSIIHIDNETFLNFGSIDYIKNIEKKLKEKKEKCFICDYQNMEHHACMLTCKKCLSCSHVLFQKH